MTYNITTAPRPRRLTARRIALIIAAMVLTPCFIALFAGMAIGISRAAAETTPAATSTRGPSQTTLDLLAKVRSTSHTSCWAEWNEDQAAQGLGDGFEVICAADPTATPAATPDTTVTTASWGHKAPRACHTAYTIFGHWVEAHTTKKGHHIARHWVATHTVKANCPA